MRYSIDYIYKGDIYIIKNGKRELVMKDEMMVYFEDEDRMITVNDCFLYVVNPLFYQEYYSLEKLEEAKKKRLESLMKYKSAEIEEGDTFVDESSIYVFLTPPDRNKNLYKNGKKRGGK